MEWIPTSYIPRANEYERLVAEVIDRRYFGPVAITTSLPGTFGMGKTTLARTASRDPRIIEAFPDGVIWVTVGENLSPLHIISRIERLIYDITGERRGLTDLKTAEQDLHNLIHPLRILLILDKAADLASLRPFLKTGPGGSCLIITTENDLPFGARSIPVDIMFSVEAAALLSAGLNLEQTGNGSGPAAVDLLPADEMLPEDIAVDLDEENGKLNLPGPQPAGSGADEAEDQHALELEAILFPADSTGTPSAKTDDELPVPQAYGSSKMAGPEDHAVLAQAERNFRAEAMAIPTEHAEILIGLAERLNEWPLLLALVNGLLRSELGSNGTAAGGALTGAVLREAVKQVHRQLDEKGMQKIWLINDPNARKQTLEAVINTCLYPLSEDERESLFELIVFPQDENIPVAAAEVLWDCGMEQAAALSRKLASRALISYDPLLETIQLHRLLRQFILDNLRAGMLTELHNRIVESYRARCPSGWSSGPDDGYFFYHLADHLFASGRRSELQELLFDFDWLVAYLNCIDCMRARRGDLYSLLNDFELALSTSLDRQSAELRLVQDAVRMAAPMLSKDSSQLAPQLLGRLLSFEEPEIQGLLEKAKNWSGSVWLKPLAPCFVQPGGEEVRSLIGHQDWVTGISILPDGQFAISSSLDGTLREWDLANGHNTRVIKAQPDGVSAQVVSPDGNYAITSGWDGVVRIWDLRTWENRRTFKAHVEAVGVMAMTPDGRRIITGANDRLIRVWSFDSGKMELELVGHGDLLRGLAVSPDGRTLVSGSWDYTVRVWDLDNGRPMHFLAGHESWVRAVAISPNGDFALSGGWDRSLKIWDLWTGEIVRSIDNFAAPIFSIKVLPDNKHFVTGGGDGSVCLWDLENGQELHKFAGHAGGVNGVDITGEGRFAVTASDDRSLRIWDLVALQGSRPQPGHTGPVYSLESLPSNRYGVSGSWDSTLKVWDLQRGEEVCTLAGHTGGVVALSVSADGRRAVSGSRDCTLKVWDLENGKESRTLSGHESSVTAVSITPDGRSAVSGSEDGALKVWDLESGACLADFRGEGSIWSCALSGDGTTIVASITGGKMYFLEIKK
jgi:WD40 repeat protein